MREPRQHLPVDMAYKDIRSASVERKRWKKNDEKYFGYQQVKPGQLGQPHYNGQIGVLNVYYFPADFTGATVTTVTKRQMWKEARPYWICHHHHRCPDKKHKWMVRDAEYHERIAKRDAQSWDKKGCQGAFADIGADTVDYKRQGIADIAMDEARYPFNDPQCDCPHCVGWPLDQGLPAETISLAPLVDVAMNKREKKRRHALKKMGWTDAAEELDIGTPGSDWMDLVIDKFDAVSEFELV